MDLDGALKQTFGALRTREGTHVSHSPVAIIAAWSETRRKKEELLKLGRDISQLSALRALPPNYLTHTITTHLYDAFYDPTTIDSISAKVNELPAWRPHVVIDSYRLEEDDE